ncbi:MAG: PEPxxWA-CTERM sorting domain-containing protein [Sphingomonas sp.]|nr:PEPxxWA-CTERM sorting domain-containing protein [Sphingomonas sp.]MDX3885727.1 PEPxxWA-CTERM sorting domain-containing protein [Sphingomonas sp.]
MWKKLSIILLCISPTPALADWSFDIDYDHPYVFNFSNAIGWDDYTTPYRDRAWTGSPASYSITIDGIFDADGRYCGDDCEPLHVVWSEDRTAIDGFQSKSAMGDFGISTPGAGTITFRTTDPSARIRITGLYPWSPYLLLDGPNNRWLPEPSSWAMLIVGFGAIGALMRRAGTARGRRQATM